MSSALRSESGWHGGHPGGTQVRGARSRGLTHPQRGLEAPVSCGCTRQAAAALPTHPPAPARKTSIFTCSDPRTSWDPDHHTARSQPGPPRGVGGKGRTAEPILFGKAAGDSAQPPGRSPYRSPSWPWFPPEPRGAWLSKHPRVGPRDPRLSYLALASPPDSRIFLSNRH